MTDPRRGDPQDGDPQDGDPQDGDPALWQPHELLAGPRISEGPDGAPVPHSPPDADAGAETGATTGDVSAGAVSAAEPVETQLSPGSLPAGLGRVALPVAVLGPRELEPYLARHPHGERHRGRGVFAADHDGRPVRGESGRWDYSAPGLRGWCRCGWTGPIHPQAPIPAQHQRTPVREQAWREANRAARTAIDLEWVDHVHLAVPSLGVTVLHWQLEIIERAFPDAVAHARRYGAPWQEIGDQAGISRQSAHERWRYLDPPREAVTPSAGVMGLARNPAGSEVGPMCARCDHAEWAHEAFGFDHRYLAPTPGNAARARHVRPRLDRPRRLRRSEGSGGAPHDGGEPVE